MAEKRRRMAVIERKNRRSTAEKSEKFHQTNKKTPFCFVRIANNCYFCRRFVHPFSSLFPASLSCFRLFPVVLGTGCGKCSPLTPHEAGKRRVTLHSPPTMKRVFLSIMACCLGFSTGAAQQTVHTTLGITWPLDFRTNAIAKAPLVSSPKSIETSPRMCNWV